MKALRSPLAQQALADPAARARLRSFSEQSANADQLKFELRVDGKVVVFQPVVVPKAA